MSMRVVIELYLFCFFFKPFFILFAFIFFLLFILRRGFFWIKDMQFLLVSVQYIQSVPLLFLDGNEYLCGRKVFIAHESSVKSTHESSLHNYILFRPKKFLLDLLLKACPFVLARRYD